jgi:predicted DCC family thiol-disulfide oxidoreductase YuxK
VSSKAPAEPAIILYDGLCGMCTKAAVRGRKYQRPGALRWVDNGSPEGQALLARFGLSAVADDSLIVIEGNRVSTESSAAVRTALRLRWPWRASAALWLVPKPLRDAGYRWVAARRDRQCALPPVAK